ncbi:CID domain-containing protein [Mycena kentingensis (nom. inval.)]|nr:CID domain-containing protein [Mycena kentingensis (nom. inval.)]
MRRWPPRPRVTSTPLVNNVLHPAMAQLAEFESVLKEIVTAKRLSASKMNTLTDLTLKSMAEDTQLVSILYRTHKSLPSPSKVSSLYVFDALARAARTQVVKQGIAGDINQRPGNSATFLLKLEGVLEGLFQDMISTAPEAKEKTKKILDIWVKGSTFPPQALAQLKEVLNGTNEKDNAVKVTVDPRAAALAVAAPPPAPVPAPPPAPVASASDPQATLLALLTQAAAKNVNLGPMIPSAPGNPPPQLSLLQQLTANLGNVVPQQQQTPVFSPRSPQPHNSPPHDENGYYSRRHDPRSDGQQHQQQRGGFRGRGRGDGRRWDERGREQNEEGMSIQRQQRRSRSRSPPPRGAARRDVRPYSPPGRPTLAGPNNQLNNNNNANAQANSMPITNDPRRSAPTASRDEFGRELRAASPSPEPPDDIMDDAPSVRASAATFVPPLSKQTQAQQTIASNNQSRMSLPTSVDANTSRPVAGAVGGAGGMTATSKPVPMPQPKAVPVSASVSVQNEAAANAKANPNAASGGGGGLEGFDLATFDFTSPDSWDALGKAWQASVGAPPSMEELMQYVMQKQQQQWGGGGGGGGGNWVGNNQPQQQQQQQFRGGGRGRGGFTRGRGGYYGGGGGGGGGGNNGGGGGWRDYGTDAVVLGGGQ